MFELNFLADTALAKTLAANMDVISLVALVIAIIVSIWKNTNLGTLALGLALVIGHLIGGVSIKELISGYPTNLLLMLAGVTFLFGIAQTNGTLDKITKYTVKSAKGNVAVLQLFYSF